MVNNKMGDNYKEAVRKHLDGYNKIINLLNKEEQNDSSYEGKSQDREDDVVLFFSYDIVNSTVYKTINYHGWSIVISGIIDYICDEVKAAKRTLDIKVWKVQGDEVIFVSTIKEKDSLKILINLIYEILIDTCSKLESGDFLKNLQGIPTAIVNDKRMNSVLSLQATSWIAVVTNRDSLKNGIEEDVENLYEVIQEEGGYRLHEFIGMDIDTGFRIASNTRAKQLAVSFELAYLLSEYTNIHEKIKIISLRKLKGVWYGKEYPIIWYYDKELNRGMSFENSLPYDAISQDDLYKEYFLKENYFGKIFNSNRDALEKILVDRKLQNKINRIRVLIEEGKRHKTKYIDTPKMELHCAVVCINKKNEVLLVKRTQRELYDEKWEVGCAKASSREELLTSIVKEYKNDFNIDIDVFCDNERDDIQPHPLAIYAVKHGDELHKGLIFVARIKKGKVSLNNAKHSESMFLSEDKIDALNEEECVSDLKDSIKKAFEYYYKFGSMQKKSR